MYADVTDCDIDERDAWGKLLSDVVKHIANGLQQNYGLEKADISSRICDALLTNLRYTDGVVEGEYWEERK